MFRSEPLGVDDNLFQRGHLLVRRVSGRRGVPAFVLLLSLVPMFLFGPDRGYFYKPIPLSGHPKSGDRRMQEHDHFMRHHMAVAANLAAEHNFLGFYYRTLTSDGKLTYRVYNRFPVGGHLLIKLVILPFSDDLSARLHAARLLMLALFAGAALLAYLSLSRLTSSRLAAFGATLLSFASWQAASYSDTVMVDGIVSLFGMMLALHGIAVFCAPSATDGERGRSVPVGGNPGLGQLSVKTCAALLLGWHVYGLVLPFAGLGLAGALGGRGGGIDWRRVRCHLTLGIVALIFGVTVLGCNLARESLTLEETPLLELPSMNSMLMRTGIYRFADSGDPTWGWTVEELVEQFRRVGMASAPYALTMFLPPTALVTLGVAVSLATVGLLGLRSAPHRLPLAALALAGVCWSLLMFDSVKRHPNEALFYVGIPLVFFSLVLRRLCAFTARPSQTRVAAGVVGVTLAGFVVSHWAVAEVKRTSQDVEMEKALIADIHAIRPWIKNKVVYIPLSPLPISSDILETRLTYYYLIDSVILVKDRGFADFVVLPPGLGSADSLTPENRFIFLYRPSTYNAALDTALRATRARYEHATQTGTPVMESDYDVYRLGNALLYVGEEQACTSARSPLFFLHIYPVHLDDLPHIRRRYGFDNRDFGRDPFWQRGETCYAVVELPGYEIARISTGQYVRNPDGSFHALWEAHHAPPLADGRNAHRSSP